MLALTRAKYELLSWEILKFCAQRLPYNISDELPEWMFGWRSFSNLKICSLQFPRNLMIKPRSTASDKQDRDLKLMLCNTFRNQYYFLLTFSFYLQSLSMHSVVLGMEINKTLICLVYSIDTKPFCFTRDYWNESRLSFSESGNTNVRHNLFTNKVVSFLRVNQKCWVKTYPDDYKSIW
jgi:hypothetical protein